MISFYKNNSFLFVVVLFLLVNCQNFEDEDTRLYDKYVKPKIDKFYCFNANLDEIKQKVNMKDIRFKTYNPFTKMKTDFLIENLTINVFKNLSDALIYNNIDLPKDLQQLITSMVATEVNLTVSEKKILKYEIEEEIKCCAYTSHIEGNNDQFDPIDLFDNFYMIRFCLEYLNLDKDVVDGDSSTLLFYCRGYKFQYRYFIETLKIDINQVIYFYDNGQFKHTTFMNYIIAEDYLRYRCDNESEDIKRYCDSIDYLIRLKELQNDMWYRHILYHIYVVLLELQSVKNISSNSSEWKFWINMYDYVLNNKTNTLQYYYYKLWRKKFV